MRVTRLDPARLDSGMDMQRGPSGSRLRPDDTNNNNAKDQKEDDPMKRKVVKTRGTDLGTLERDLLEYDENGELDELFC